MDFLWRHWPELVLCPVVAWLQLRIARELAAIAPPGWSPAIRTLGCLAAAWIIASVLLGTPLVSRRWRVSDTVEWIKGTGLAWAAVSCSSWVMLAAIRWISGRSRDDAGAVDAGKRRLILLAKTAAVAAPAAAMGYGVFVERYWFQTVEVKIPIRGLAKDLDGLRIVQLSDIHMGSFFSAADLEHAIAMANETKAHLALVTGDLINAKRDPLDKCMDLLRGLKADAGQLGCLGNHEVFANCENYAARRGRQTGLEFLRGYSREVTFGAAAINFAGVDYQPKSKPYLRQAAGLIRPDRLNVLLSHNPDVFPVAAAQGWDLTIAGHTHGGQITVEILGPAVNPARFYTPYIRGRYEEGGRQIYVSRGLGTVGVPARVGAPPEVSLITLCAT